MARGLTSYLIYFAMLSMVIVHISSSFAMSTPRLALTQAEKNWLSDHTDITIGYDPHFPPYSFLNQQGELEGFAVDVFRLLEQQLGTSFTHTQNGHWDELFDAAKQQQVDAVATMVQRPERMPLFAFTEPYIRKTLVVITQASNNDLLTRSDLHNKTIALVKSYQYIERILEEFPDITPLYVDTILDGLNAVSAGEADATITFAGAAHHYRTQYLLANLRYALIYDQDDQSFERIAVRKDWASLAEILDRALTAIPESQLQQLRTKWLPVEDLDAIVDVHLTAEERRWLDAHRDIRLGIDPEFAPFEYMEDGAYKGMASDYIRLLNQRLDINMSVVEGLSWREVINRAQKRQIDVLPAVGKNAQRKTYLAYTEPYLNFHRVIVTRDDAPLIMGLSDLHEADIAVQINSSHHGYLRENTDVIPTTYPTLQAALLALSGGENDAFIGNVAASSYWIRKLNLSNLKIAAPVSSDAQKLHFAVRDDWPELASILQKGLDSISDRQKRQISERWLTLKYEDGDNTRLILRIVIILAIALLVILIWNLLLKWQIKKHTNEALRSAYYDQLTDLPNRFLIQERLEQHIYDASKYQDRIALISVALDNFKKINDSIGYHAGDQLLKQAASRLQTIIKAHHDINNGELGRLGGDQFLVVTNELLNPADAGFIAEELLRELKRPFTVEKQQFTLGASVGISIYPDDGHSAELLLKYADSATNHAKQSSKGGYSFFTKELNQSASRFIELETNIRSALNNQEFEVHYQPKVDTRQQVIKGFEALIRWNSPTLGQVPPCEFIPVAEKTGQIEHIGNFVIQQALSALSAWQQRFNPNLTMAINISPVHFQDRDLLTTLRTELKARHIKPETLELEITEGVLLGATDVVKDCLRTIEQLGVKLAMDDFGTGYSSLSNLRKYNFNTIKIDREFITDICTSENDRQLTSATIAMARGLNLQVVAEGVETQEQQTLLNELGCDLSQGWLFSKAEPADVISKMLEAEYTKENKN